MTNQPPDDPMIQVLEYLRLALRYKWHIMVGTCALTLLLTVIIARLPNVYQATTTILVDPQQIPEHYVFAGVGSDPGARLSTITQQVLSRTRLENIIAKLNLYPERRNVVAPELLIEAMRRDITIQLKKGSGPELSTFTITFQGSNAGVVANVANELANTFIQWNVASREQQVAGTQDFLSAELKEAKQNLEQQESKLSHFKMSHAGETPDQTTNNFQALEGLRTSLQANQDAMNRLDEQKLLLTQLPQSAVTSNDGSANLSERDRLESEERQLEASLQQLRAQYSDRYPDVVRAKRRLDDINTRLEAIRRDPDTRISGQDGGVSATTVRLELIDKEMNRLQAEQSRIQSRIASYQGKIDVSPMREQELVELTRNYETSKQHYQSLLEKSFSISMAADLEQKQKGERYTVLDPAQVPQKPSKPNRRLLIPLSSLLALGICVGSVIAKEAISPAVKTEAELRALLPSGAGIIGFIPRIQTAGDERRQRRFALMASAACLLLCVVEAAVIWRSHAIL